jgi:hypothetical protein
MDKLTLSESGRLINCEKAIQANKESFIKAGLALEEVRDKRLYRVKYGTFQEYCLKRWGFQRSYGYQLIESAKVASEMSAIADIRTEGAARSLAKVEPEKRVEILKSAGASGKPVTASSITKAAAPVKTSVCVQLDEIGRKVPDKAMPWWNRRGEVQELMNTISKDLLFHEVNFSATYAALETAYVNIKRGKAFAVCLSCQGKLTDTCTVCGGRGIVSETLYGRFDEKRRKIAEGSRALTQSEDTKAQREVQLANEK